MRRIVGILLALALAGCVREVVLSPTPDAGVPDADNPDGDTPPDGTTLDTNGALPDAALGG
jgi:hypothetical protein